MSNRTNNLKVYSDKGMELDDYNGNGYYDIKDFLEAPNNKILEHNNMKKFDVVLANPPYDNGLCDKFNSRYFDLCDGQICWVSPSSWLLSKKQNKRVTEKVDEHYTEISSITGSDYFDAGISGLISIVYIDMAKDEHKIVFDDIEYDKCFEQRKG